MKNNIMFAFGSNLNLEQMAMRCPAAKPLQKVRLDNYDLEFWGNRRNNGVATIVEKEGSYVYGALWEITEECRIALDRYEGFPWLYNIKEIEVVDMDRRRHKVFTYYMVQGELTVPSQAYLDIIEGGCEDFNISKHNLLAALGEQMERMSKK